MKIRNEEEYSELYSEKDCGSLDVVMTEKCLKRWFLNHTIIAWMIVLQKKYNEQNKKDINLFFNLNAIAFIYSQDRDFMKIFASNFKRYTKKLKPHNINLDFLQKYVDSKNKEAMRSKKNNTGKPPIDLTD